MLRNAIEILLCLSVLYTVCESSPLPGNGSTYDQRQTGDYNIHISLKDIRIIALLSGGLGGSEDYDYNYDYSEMTIKPSPGETNKTKSTTTQSTITSNTTVDDSSTTTEKVVEITPPNPQTTTSKSPTTSNSTVDNKNATIDSNNATIDNKNATIDSKNATESNTNGTESPNISKPTRKPDNQDIPVQIVLTPVQILSDNAKPTTSPTTTAVPLTTTAKVKQANCIEGFVKDRHGNCRQRVRKPQQQSLLRKLIQMSQRTPPARQKNISQ
ncbi:uncharacterized protein LOC143921237 [Arctopsyche grandis]|uniref:uncharacterized protein LOC143921237 n=1 Tax=Arctopsyche grandis TaxID=121162 RepID=UPI00406D8C99